MDLLGIDIGGTKTSVCIGNRRGEILVSRRIPTRADEAAVTTIARILELARSVVSEAGLDGGRIRAVGLSTPGPVSVSRGLMLKPPNMPGWVNVPMLESFRKGLGRPTAMNNDANACALAEYLFGECKGTRDLVYLTMSTGLGAGVIVNGQLLQGVSDTGGEIGHHVLDADGPPCPCGQRGCLELYCGGRNLALRLQEEIRRQAVRTRILDLAGGEIERIDFSHFLAAAREGDAFAVRRWEEYLERLAQGIGTVIMFYNPAVIVLGTIAIHAGEFLLAPLRERIRHYAWPAGVDACRLTASALGTRIGDLSALAVAASLKLPEEG